MIDYDGIEDEVPEEAPEEVPEENPEVKKPAPKKAEPPKKTGVVFRRKKRRRRSERLHGGSWKVAYADFITAMMAFFMLMWFIAIMPEHEKFKISGYFNKWNKDETKKDDPALSPEEQYCMKMLKLDQQEQVQFESMMSQISQAIDKNSFLRQFKDQMLLDITQDGLRIQIIDQQNRPMFDTGKAELQPYFKQLLQEVGHMLNTVPNYISLAGHTDASVYATDSSQYSNWELSADRANAARRNLVVGGMNDAKVLRVVGLSSAVPLDKDDPLKAINRRISIVVLSKRAADSITHQEKERSDLPASLLNPAKTVK